MSATNAFEHMARELYPDGKLPSGHPIPKSKNEAKRMRRELQAEIRKIDRKAEGAVDKIIDCFKKECGQDDDIARWKALNSEAKVFHIANVHIARTLLIAYPVNEVPIFVAPFPIFKIVLDERPEYILPAEINADDRATQLKTFAPEAWIVDARDSAAWHIREHALVTLFYDPNYEKDELKFYERIANRVKGEYVVQYCSPPMRLDPFDGSFDEEAYEKNKMFGSGGDLPGPSLSGPALVRAFCAFANHRDVHAVAIPDPNRPETRQQRRAQKYKEQEHYRIVIRGKPNTIGKEIGEKKNIRERREHDVRSHLRTQATGRISVVRAHRRCRGQKPFLTRDYELSPDLRDAWKAKALQR
jgi:hypothetical protein